MASFKLGTDAGDHLIRSNSNFLTAMTREPRKKLPWTIQLKRFVIGLIGVALVACTALASIKIVTERGANEYWLLILTIGLLVIGLAMIRIAFKGRAKDIQDVLW